MNWYFIQKVCGTYSEDKTRIWLQSLLQKKAQDANAGQARVYLKILAMRLETRFILLWVLWMYCPKNQPRQDQSSLLRTIQFSTQQLQKSISE